MLMSIYFLNNFCIFFGEFSTNIFSIFAAGLFKKLVGGCKKIAGVIVRLL